MNTITVKADNRMTKALITIFEAFGLSFDVKKAKEKDSPYDPEFVKMILERAENAKKGETVVYTEELKNELFNS